MNITPIKRYNLKFHKGVNINSVIESYTKNIRSFYKIDCYTNITLFGVNDVNTDEPGYYFERVIQNTVVWCRVLFRKKNKKGNYIQAKNAFEMKIKIIMANQKAACDNDQNAIEKENEFLQSSFYKNVSKWRNKIRSARFKF